MQADERAGQQSEKPVDVLDGEARPVAQPRASRERQARDHSQAQQPEGDQAAGAGDVPLDEAHAATPSAPNLRDHSSFGTKTSPSAKRPGRPRSASQAGPSRPSKNAAF